MWSNIDKGICYVNEKAIIKSYNNQYNVYVLHKEYLTRNSKILQNRHYNDICAFFFFCRIIILYFHIKGLRFI